MCMLAEIHMLCDPVQSGKIRHHPRPRTAQRLTRIPASQSAHARAERPPRLAKLLPAHRRQSSGPNLPTKAAGFLPQRHARRNRTLQAITKTATRRLRPRWASTKIKLPNPPSASPTQISAGRQCQTTPASTALLQLGNRKLLTKTRYSVAIKPKKLPNSAFHYGGKIQDYPKFSF